jgi:hypothetical protein
MREPEPEKKPAGIPLPGPITCIAALPSGRLVAGDAVGRLAGDCGLRSAAEV